MYSIMVLGEGDMSMIPSGLGQNRTWLPPLDKRRTILSAYAMSSLKEQRRRQSTTLLTGPMGVTEQPVVRKATLLGG